jgi:hypothetical protein
MMSDHLGRSASVPVGSPQEIARLLREHNLESAVASTRMPWAPDWPLDRLMCAAADLLDPPAVPSGSPEREHELKCWPEFFKPIASGAKTHEVRKFDRDYRVGDVLVLREYHPNLDSYTGREVRVRVTYLAQAFLPPDLIAMSVSLLALRVPEPSAQAASKQVRRQLVTIMDQNGSEPALAVRRMMSEVITPLVLRLAAAPPVVGGWQAIESAPKEGRFDVWAKAWLPAFDRFEYRRFTDCYWRKADSMGSWEAGIVGLDKDWRATHWMPLPPAPGVAVTREELPQNDYAKRLILAQPDDGETR